MVERFVAIGRTEADIATRSTGSSPAFGRFLSVFAAGGHRAIPSADGEFQTASPTVQRPAILLAGTPDQIVDALQATLDETGARRLLVETFSKDEARNCSPPRSAGPAHTQRSRSGTHVEHRAKR